MLLVSGHAHTVVDGGCSIHGSTVLWTCELDITVAVMVDSADLACGYVVELVYGVFVIAGPANTVLDSLRIYWGVAVCHTVCLLVVVTEVVFWTLHADYCIAIQTRIANTTVDLTASHSKGGFWMACCARGAASACLERVHGAELAIAACRAADDGRKRSSLAGCAVSTTKQGSVFPGSALRAGRAKVAWNTKAPKTRWTWCHICRAFCTDCVTHCVLE